MDGCRGGTPLSPCFNAPLPPWHFFFENVPFFFGVFRTRRSSRRRNACGKRRGGARKRSGSGRRSENGSGGKRRSSSARCAMKRNGWSARSETERVRGPPAAACGASVERVRRCVPVPRRRGVSRGQVRHSHRAFLFFYLCGLAERRCPVVVASASSTGVGGYSKAPSGSTSTGPSKIARPSSAVSSARGTTGIPRGMSKRP